MKTWTKELIFFSVVLVLYLVFGKVVLEMKTKGKMGHTLSLLISGVVYTLLLVGVFALLQKEPEGFHFQVTPEKACALYPYVVPPDVDCSKYTQQQLNRYNCCDGYHGRPVLFNYTPESNAHWENTRCQGKVSYEPPVL